MVAVPPPRWWASTWAFCILLVVLTVAAYSPVRLNPFIDYDDPAYVSENQHVLSGLHWNTVVWSFTTTEQQNWHPLTWLSHAVDCQFFGTNAGAHHLSSLCLHAINVVLLFLLLQTVTGRRECCFLVAALFALHPFNVDSVAWIAERKNLLSTLFFFLSLGAYGWYARKPGWRRYALLCLMFILGLLAKPMLVTLPFVLLLTDYWPLQRVEGWTPPAEFFPVPQTSVKQLLLDKLPLLALAGISSAITLFAQQKAMQRLQDIPLVARLENAVASYFLYVFKTFWPSGFAVHYPNLFSPFSVDPVGIEAWGPFVAGLFLLVAVSWIAWQQRRVRPYLFIGWLWYLGTLVPVIGVVQVGIQGMADRYAYIPLIGLFIIVSWGAAEIADHLRLNFAWRSTAVALMLAALSLLTFRQVGYWRTSYALWMHARDVTRNNTRALDHIGYQLMVQHRPDDALQYFKEAARVGPTDADSHLMVAANLQDSGRLREAIPEYEVVVRGSDDPQQIVFSYFNLCLVFGELGEFSRSHEAFSRARSTNSELTEAKIRELQGMVSAQPSDEGFLRLGLVAEQVGQTTDARTDYEQALRLNPRRIETQRALQHLLSTQPNTP